MNFKPTIRPAERLAYCRACGGKIEKGETMMSWYSSANRGMHIHLHIKCCKEIGKMAGELE